MQTIDLEIEAVQIAIYINIIQNILKKHKELSLPKMLTFSYLVKMDHFRLTNIYNANNKQDIVYKAISMMAGEYEDYCNTICFILKALHLLIIKKKVILNGIILSLASGTIVDKEIYNESGFLSLAIEESKKMTDKQFMKEVTASV